MDTKPRKGKGKTKSRGKGTGKDQQPKLDISLYGKMLTPSEIERLRQKSRDDFAYLQKVFPGLKLEP